MLREENYYDSKLLTCFSANDHDHLGAYSENLGSQPYLIGDSITVETEIFV